MGMDYTATVVVGFRITWEKLFKLTTVTTPSCDHSEREEYEYCSTCGRKVEDYKTDVSITKKKYDHLVTRDEEGYVEDTWNGTLFKTKVKILNLTNAGCEEQWFVGTIVADIDVRRDGYKFARLPNYVEKSLAAYLKDQGVPFDPKTYGIHTTGLVY